MFVRTQPDAVAVEHTAFNDSITYAQLEIRANRLARRLRSQDIGPGKRVCILARRSVAFVAAILAVLKSGAQYVPLDAATIPPETLKVVLNDAEPSVVLVMDEFANKVLDVPKISLEIAIRDDQLANADASPVEDRSSPTDGAYCIYTSGTTGKPKGVDVRHQGVTNVLSGPPGNVGMKPGMRVGQFLSIAFDMGAWEILGSLYNGATLCIRGGSRTEWKALMKTVDIVIATPSILEPHKPEDYQNIKQVIVGGEPCPQELADKWARYTSFSNCCGPTEISICNTVQPHTPGYPLSIGKPIPNTNVYILSSDPSTTEAVPIGKVGYMWVGGIGVSNGYLNLPDKTAERRKKDPFVEGGMMFNTGDLGKWREDGQLDHMGREDDQVKINGFRVDLCGISATITEACKPIASAVAQFIGSELWYFVTPSDVDLASVRNTAATVLSKHYVPTRYIALDRFPTTANGKLDKRQLVAMVEADLNGYNKLPLDNRGGTPAELPTVMIEQPLTKRTSVPSPPAPPHRSHAKYTRARERNSRFNLEAPPTMIRMELT
jgi:amino acid adenylation domain-containing protein